MKKLLFIFILLSQLTFTQEYIAFPPLDTFDEIIFFLHRSYILLYIIPILGFIVIILKYIFDSWINKYSMVLLTFISILLISQYFIIRYFYSSLNSKIIYL